MKKMELVSIFFAATIFLLAGMGYADTINDNYIGGTPNYSSYVGADVIGSPDLFDISKMEVTFAGTQMTVDIYSTYFDNIGAYSTALGDLFVSTNGYNPTVPSTLDTYNNGEKWEYAVVLDDHSGGQKSGSAAIYSINENNIIMSSAPGYIFREDQEVQYNGTIDDALASGQWWIADDSTYLSIIMDFADLGLDWSDIQELGYHWAMTCGNDVIEGSVPAPVPEPATMLLFGTGLIGMATVGRKKFQKKS